ncbi:MAG: hypothetical protein HWE20_10445 [Gammaproteobacteria bacterium]|nr:hypothetical protein [Gammaproteobacteria bacterium]
MKALFKHWPKNLFWVTLFSTGVMSALYGLEFSEWAESVRLGSALVGDDDHGDPPLILLMILPLIKTLVLTGVPLMAGLGIGRLYQRVAG